MIVLDTNIVSELMQPNPNPRGRPISEADCQIAAIARRWGASVATRDTAGFEGCGVDVINPWDNP